jgi:hypothetical protein
MKTKCHPSGLIRLVLIGVIGFAFLIGSGAPAWADLEDVLMEKGTITKEEWLKIKAEKEKLKAQQEAKGLEYRVSELPRSESFAALKGVEIGVVVYLNATYATGTSFTGDATKGVSNSTANNNKGLASGFRFSRTYLNVRKYFENGDHFRLTLDQMVNDIGGKSCNQTANTGAGGQCTEAAPFGLSGFGGNGRNSTFVKYAYYEHVFMPGVQLRFGMHQTPWIEYEENRWTYRYLFPIMVDQQGFQTSSDLGVSLLGKVLNNMLEYHISFQEGEGYQNTPDGRGYAVLGRVSVEPIKGVIISAFGHNERERNGVEGFNPQRALSNVEVYDPSKDTFKINAQAVWADDGADMIKSGNPTKINVPGVYNPTGVDAPVILGSGNNGPLTSTPRFHQARGYEFWAWYRIPGIEKVRLHGRYYFMKPNKDTVAGDIQAYYFGISYDYSKFLAFSLDYTVMQETVLGSNLTVGGQSIATITGGACAACGQFVNYNNQILGLRALITF